MKPFTLKPALPVRFEAQLDRAGRIAGFVIHPQDRKHGFACEIEAAAESEFSRPYVSAARVVITNSEAKPVPVLVHARVQYADGLIALVALTATIEGNERIGGDK
jgi:hypothetical protein